MDVLIRPDSDSATRLVSELIARTVAAKPDVVLGLATGRTMEALYAELVRRHQEDGLDFSQVRCFNLDEYVGLPADSPQSYRRTMSVSFFDRVNIQSKNVHLPIGTAPDLDAESAAYEKRILDAGGIDLQLLGIGQSGHIGFNEPLSALRSRTRVKALTPETLQQNAAYFGGDVNAVPRRAITMGVGTILDSRRCVMLATGAHKAAILAEAIEGPVTSRVTASALQLHPKCTVVVDEAAAESLRHQEYYRWLFDHEPEWESYRDSF